MTGYGRAEGSVAGRPISVEVRCLNHRFRDIRLSLPRQWGALEVEVERTIRRRIARGRVDCSVHGRSLGGEIGRPALDEQRLWQFTQIYQRMAELLDLSEAPDLALLARSEGVITYEPEQEDPALVRSALIPVLEQALQAADAMRRAEGEQLRQEVDGHLQVLQDRLSEIRRRIPDEQRTLNERTAERIGQLAGQVEVDAQRLAQELAIVAERSDVTEELARLDSHLVQFHQLTDGEQPVGRELDFLLQEMNREVNTLCAKLHCADVVRQAVAARADLEKIREQVQNLE